MAELLKHLPLHRKKSFRTSCTTISGHAFPTLKLNPRSAAESKNFKPDCGISNVGAAIEFKIAHNEEAAKVAFSGVVEDTADYKGSKQWTRFYAVIYQAKPFLQKSHMKRDMKRIGAATWTPILLNGKTTQRKKSAKATNAKPGRKATK